MSAWSASQETMQRQVQSALHIVKNWIAPSKVELTISLCSTEKQQQLKEKEHCTFHCALW
jgi:hypothetical protein